MIAFGLTSNACCSVRFSFRVVPQNEPLGSSDWTGIHVVDGQIASNIAQETDFPASSLTIYTPESNGEGFVSIWRGMFRDLWQCRALAWRLFIRDLAAAYRQSFLGYLWVLLPPVVTTAVFVFLRRANIVNIGDTDIPYIAYVMFGMLIWGIGNGAFNATRGSISAASGLITKINFPREALVLASLGNMLFQTSIQTVLVIGVFVWWGVVPSWTIVFMPILLFFMLLFTTGLGFVFSMAQAISDDVGRSVGLVRNIIMYSAPIVYPAPVSWPYRLLNDYNPVSIYIIAARDLTTGHGLTNPSGVAIMCLLSVLTFLAGWRVFRICMSVVSERL